ncbi:uncharacterized protein PV09_04133 [Verruconis gallopava]|uniref:DUF1770 domain-containing protein n=1 Tax=Verruconis gallopava TaxID=253628 RepID=A0A0D1XQQ2_9PEZI|nr:uncharacterized protein PV09_04133 [Verruconis gallopava]KIW04971.1 hypothetical protein PV09_04133 [Verruconis gallopava]
MAEETPHIGELASAIQSASIQHHPSPEHDINPSTAASLKTPVRLDEDANDAIDDSDLEEDEVPLNVLRPLPRRQGMPPLPDMRFEQSYLRSIEKADNWMGVAYITFRDQIMLPLLQGFTWSLIVFGWRHWNRASQFSGATIGARIRRWWWGVNNWRIPDEKRNMSNKRLAADVRDFYEFKFSNAGSD